MTALEGVDILLMEKLDNIERRVASEREEGDWIEPCLMSARLSRDHLRPLGVKRGGMSDGFICEDCAVWLVACSTLASKLRRERISAGVGLGYSRIGSIEDNSCKGGSSGMEPKRR